MTGSGGGEATTLRRVAGTAVAGILASLAWVVPVAGQDPGEARAPEGVSAELEALYRADQDDRSFAEPPSREEWEAIGERDRARRNRVLELVRAGALSSADDHFHAAMVLQHGTEPEHYLVAHILATVAGFRGHEGGRWLSAASLDRYLHNIDRPQRLGTQYLRAGPDEALSMGAYEDWLPDSVREAYGVPPLEQQKARLDSLNLRWGGGA